MEGRGSDGVSRLLSRESEEYHRTLAGRRLGGGTKATAAGKAAIQQERGPIITQHLGDPNCGPSDVAVRLRVTG